MAKVEKILVETEDGKPIYIRKVTPVIRAGSLSGHSTIDGLPFYETADGAKCNRDGDTFLVLETGQRLTMR
jgi:hypothetical protein